MLKTLKKYVLQKDTYKVIKQLIQIVPEYQPTSERLTGLERKISNVIPIKKRS